MSNRTVERMLNTELNTPTDPSATALRNKQQPTIEAASVACPFNVRNLSVLAYANDFTLWHYKTTNLNDCKAVGYFDDVSDMMCVGDLIVVSGSGGGAVVVVSSVVPVVMAVAI